LPLRHRIDLAVGTDQRGQHERAAAQRLGLAHRRDGDVELLSRLGEGRQLGSDHHHRGILERRVDPRRQRQAEAGGDALHRLDGIFEIVVTRAGKPDDDAVAGQLVRADALEGAEILDPLGICRRGREEDRGHSKEGRTSPLPHPATHRVAWLGGRVGERAGAEAQRSANKSNEEAGHVSHPQNGLMTEKKRPSHP
jgi:hypothetical protein